MFRLMRMVRQALLSAGPALIVGSRSFGFSRSLAGYAAQRSQSQHQQAGDENANKSLKERQRRRGQDLLGQTSNIDGTKETLEVLALHKRAPDATQAKLLSAPPENAVQISHSNLVRKSERVVKAMARLETGSQVVQKALEGQTAAREHWTKRVKSVTAGLEL